MPSELNDALKGLGSVVGNAVVIRHSNRRSGRVHPTAQDRRAERGRKAERRRGQKPLRRTVEEAIQAAQELERPVVLSCPRQLETRRGDEPARLGYPERPV